MCYKIKGGKLGKGMEDYNQISSQKVSQIEK